MFRFVLYCVLLYFVIFPISGNASEDYKISTGCGGGFTASYTNYSIINNGDIIKNIHRFVPANDQEHDSQLIGNLPIEKVEKLYFKLKNINFANIHFKKSHNVTCSLVLEKEDVNHTVYWPMGCNNNPSCIQEYSAPSDLIKVIAIHKEILAEVSKITR